MEHFAEEHLSCRLLLQKWSTLTEMEMVLQIPYKATIALQEKELSLSDVYGIWLNMQVHLRLLMKKCKTSFAKCLKECIVMRKKTIFENPVTSAAVYLDPRYRTEILRKEEQRNQAIEFLTNLHNRIQNIKTIAAPVENEQVNNVSALLEECNVSIDFNDPKQLQKYLNRSSASSLSDNSFDLPEQRDIGFDIRLMIELFQPEKVDLRKDKTIVQIWEDLKTENPHLYELATVIYAVPPTEVEMERNFSSLEFILTPRRGNLYAENLEDILLLHLNSDLFLTIKDEMLANIH